jgi:hypothetical protein
MECRGASGDEASGDGAKLDETSGEDVSPRGTVWAKVVPMARRLIRIANRNAVSVRVHTRIGRMPARKG